jgi:hypothetical protein
MGNLWDRDEILTFRPEINHSHLVFSPKYIRSMVSGFFEQTVERRGSLIFCVRRSFEASPHSGREGESLTAWP